MVAPEDTFKHCRSQLEGDMNTATIRRLFCDGNCLTLNSSMPWPFAVRIEPDSMLHCIPGYGELGGVMSA